MATSQAEQPGQDLHLGDKGGVPLAPSCQLLAASLKAEPTCRRQHRLAQGRGLGNVT